MLLSVALKPSNFLLIRSVLFEVLASSVSIIETTSVISHNLGVTPVAIAGVFFL